MSSDTVRGMRPRRPSIACIEAGPGGTVLCRPAEADEFMTDENVFILESWRSPRDPALSIARARLVPGATSVPHRLRATDERYLIVAGHGRVEVPGLGPRDVGPGDVVFFPAGQPQTITNVGTVDLVLYAICTPPFEAENYVELSEPGP